MEGIKKLAIAYYGRASEEKKDCGRDLFERLDKNGDGKVSLLELKSTTSSWLSDDKVLKKLDVNGDGTLDIDELLLALHYMVEKVDIITCTGCDDLLVGPYFSCFECLEKSPKTYDLCCDCYGKGKFKHEHCILDNLSLLKLFRRHLMVERKTPVKGEMEGIKKLVKAYYGRASEEDKHLAREFFKKVDKDGDGKVNHPELMESISSSVLSLDKLFKKFDVNGDGTLDSDEVLAVQYLVKKEVAIPICTGCSDLLLGSYFSCRLCLEKSPNTYDLCYDCYVEGKFEHEHSSSNFLDHHSLLRMFRNRLTEEQNTPRKKAMMEELSKIARAHYQAGSKEVQAKAHEFFNSMDSDGDKQIDLSEFLAFMKDQGYDLMRNRPFFEELDRDGNGTLDFWEVMTIYYIIKSGRPFCDSCANFIPGIFYSCVECYKNIESSFTLCHDCYLSTKSNHNHDGHTQFLDNYTLLQVQRDSPQATRINRLQVSPQPNNIGHHHNQVSNASTAIVQAHKVKKWGAALKAFELALAIGNISATVCTIL